AEAALGVMASEVAPLWLEVGGPGALPEGPGDGAALVVGLAGIAEEVAHARARTLELARARGLRAITVADGAALRARLAGFALVRGIKAAFDPGGLFAPGRFVAGI